MLDHETEMTESAYRRMEERIRRDYPDGYFVAIAGGEIVGAADDFMTLHKALKVAGRDPRAVLIVQAGHVYPERATIFAMKMMKKVSYTFSSSKKWAGHRLIPEPMISNRRR